MREISGSGTGRRYTGKDGIAVPGWFARELRLIDDRFYVEWDRFNGYFRVLLDVKQLVDVDGKIQMITHPLTRAVFEEFDGRILDNLRKRKWIGRHFRSNQHYYAWLKDQEKIRKAKESDTNQDMITEGVMKIDRMERTKTFT